MQVFIIEFVFVCRQFPAYSTAVGSDLTVNLSFCCDCHVYGISLTVSSFAC